jgi:TRAP-type C4-dicarboxylate transport system substrate-binding protein
MSIKQILKGAALAAALTSFTLAQAREFRSAEVHPPDYPTTMAVVQMGKQLSDQTKGRLAVKVYPNGALGSGRTTSSSCAWARST